jgi:hypothetical protein
VAGRPALVRVFVALTGATTQPGVTGRLTRYVSGAAQDALTTGPVTVLAATDEGSLAETLNFNLPAAWLAAGTSYVLDLDPANSLPETNEANNRYPPAGQASFNFQTAPALNVVIVPVHYAHAGAPTSDPPTADLSYLTWMPIKVYPVAQINYALHASVSFNENLGDPSTGGTAWGHLLEQITTVHDNEDPGQTKEYVGLVDSVAADGCGGGCIAGIGWVNSQSFGVQKTAVSFAGFASNRNTASPVITHEMGHNFGRGHSPCGTQQGLQTDYPYAGAVLGQWGYDNAAGQLKDPNAYRDYMSYCNPTWTSDFTYKAIFNAWSWLSQPFRAAPGRLIPAWVISGFYSPVGPVQVGPAHLEPVLPAQLASGGPLHIELLDGAGRVLLTQAFSVQPVSLDFLRSGFDWQGFRVALPVVPGLAGYRLYRGGQLLLQRQATGPAPRLAAGLSAVQLASGAPVGWRLAAGPAGVTYTARVSSDGGQTWQVLAVDQAAPAVALPPNLSRSGGPVLVEIQASDGVRIDTQRLWVKPPG